MHFYDEESAELAVAIVKYAMERTKMDPPPLDKPYTLSELNNIVGQTIKPEGRNGLDVLQEFIDELAPSCISVDHPLFLSFVPGAPTESSLLFDLVVSVSNVYAGSWLEGAGAVYAENQALRWIADLAGMPAETGGVFVTGGTAGNLSALLAARWNWRNKANGALDAMRPLIVASGGSHSSVAQAAKVMDADVKKVPVDERGKTSGAAMKQLIDSLSEVDETNEINKINIEPTRDKLFSSDVFSLSDDNTVCLLHSSVRAMSIIPGIVVLNGNKTYGKYKDKYLYKCIPDDRRLPVFVIPYAIKIGFNKNIDNKYIVFKFDHWVSKHPQGTIISVLGDVDKLDNFYEYQLGDPAIQMDIQKVSWEAYAAVNGTGYTRVDVRVDKHTGQPHVLEVNAQCGISEDENFTSIGAILKYANQSFTELIIHIINDAFARRRKN